LSRAEWSAAEIVKADRAPRKSETQESVEKSSGPDQQS
jgi:hypothetical protein